MFKKILFPTDFSANSNSVIPYLKKLKDSGAKEIVILHVIDSRYGEFVDLIDPLGNLAVQHFDADIYLKMKQETIRKAEAVKKKLEKDFKVKLIIDEGVPFVSILKIAEKEKVSLIAIGSHGKSDIGDMLLGSVAEKVVRKSKKPCFIVKRG